MDTIKIKEEKLYTFAFLELPVQFDSRSRTDDKRCIFWNLIPNHSPISEVLCHLMTYLLQELIKNIIVHYNTKRIKHLSKL